MKQAVVIAGGKGTRLRSRTGDTPKALVDIGGTPLLGHQIRLLAQHSFTDVVLLLSYRADEIRSYCEREQWPGLNIAFVCDPEARGTAGAVLSVISRLADQFAVVYGDTMLNVDLTRFWNWHCASDQNSASLFLHPNDHPYDSDLVELDECNRVAKFHSYPHPPGEYLPNLVNAALYIVRKNAISPFGLRHTPSDFAKELFPEMLSRGAILRGYVSPEYIKDAGTPHRLDEVRRDYASGKISRATLQMPRPGVLVDRDGTLNEERGHIARAEDFHVFAQVGPALRRLNQEEWRTAVITNQPVIARGEATYAEVRRIHAKLDSEMAEHGAYFDRLYYCPHHPDSGFPGEIAALKCECDCRKPATGMIRQAERDLNLNLNESWFIGDTLADLQAANSAGVSCIILGQAGSDLARQSNFTALNFAAAVDFIVELYPAIAKQCEPILNASRPESRWLVQGHSASDVKLVASVIDRESRNRQIGCTAIPSPEAAFDLLPGTVRIREDAYAPSSYNASMEVLIRLEASIKADELSSAHIS